MPTGVVSWSKAAASNATADSNVNFAEGQAPSSLNDSARALMASAAMYRDDIAGTLATGGSSTAYTLTTNQVFASLALMSGHMVAFVPHTTSGAAPTLNVDGLGAKPLRSAPSTALGAGVLVQGTPYVATYNNSTAEWILHAFFSNPYGIPIGGILPFTGGTAPNSNFVFTYGQAISRTTYSAYFALVSTTYGTGDGSTTFNIPDLRGRAIFGPDDMGGVAAGRITTAGSGIDGAAYGAVGGAQNVTVLQANLPSVTLTTSIASGQGSHVHGGLPQSAGVKANIGETGNVSPQYITASTVNIDAATLPAMTGTTPLGGSGTAVNKMPPAIVLPFILRIL